MQIAPATVRATGICSTPPPTALSLKLINQSSIVQQNIDNFFAAIEPLKGAYRTNSFSYVAVETVDRPILLQGMLFLNVLTPTIPMKAVEVKPARAGHFYLEDVGLTREQALAQLCKGKLTTPNGELRFPPNSDSGQYGAQFQPYHELGIREQRRIVHLSLLGAEMRLSSNNLNLIGNYGQHRSLMMAFRICFPSSSLVFCEL